jgi:hypothetical protein
MPVKASKPKSWKYTYPFITGSGAVALLFSFGLAVYAFFNPDQTDIKNVPLQHWRPYRLVEVITLVLWVVLPPIVLWFEYFYIYRRRAGYRAPDTPPPDWEMFKYAQDLSAKVWLAVSTALLILYFGKDIRI